MKTRLRISITIIAGIALLNVQMLAKEPASLTNSAVRLHFEVEESFSPATSRTITDSYMSFGKRYLTIRTTYGPGNPTTSYRKSHRVYVLVPFDYSGGFQVVVPEQEKGVQEIQALPKEELKQLEADLGQLLAALSARRSVVREKWLEIAVLLQKAQDNAKTLFREKKTKEGREFRMVPFSEVQLKRVRSTVSYPATKDVYSINYENKELYDEQLSQRMAQFIDLKEDQFFSTLTASKRDYNRKRQASKEPDNKEKWQALCQQINDTLNALRMKTGSKELWAEELHLWGGTIEETRYYELKSGAVSVQKLVVPPDEEWEKRLK